MVLEKIFYLVLDFCIVGSYNKINKRTERQCRGGGGVLVVGGSVLLEYIIKGWMIVMLVKSGWKFKVAVNSKGVRSGRIDVDGCFDNRTGKWWSKEEMVNRGLTWFLDLQNLKESLNWNLNGDDQKYQFVPEMTTKKALYGTAYIYD